MQALTDFNKTGCPSSMISILIANVQICRSRLK
jgi:hypothetical protein